MTGKRDYPSVCSKELLTGSGVGSHFAPWPPASLYWTSWPNTRANIMRIQDLHWRYHWQELAPSKPTVDCICNVIHNPSISSALVMSPKCCPST